LSLHVYRENIGSDRLVIRQLEEKDASGLAIFLNECEEGWPGGFTGGIPFTPQRVLEDLKKEKALAYLVLNYNDKIIGICTIHEHWMHKNAGYIGFLNLHPEYHGKGLGRRLLMQGIRYGIDAGFERLDLGTWAGNMKAVPLYKKTGFYWIPGTRVHMQNYIPKILVFPIAKEFFQKYPDWYSNFKRSLKVEEDDMKEKSMNVFIYKWEKNGEKLKVLVDREAFSIAGLEDGDISVMCWPILHEAPAGYSQKVKWYIKNKQEKRIKGSLLVSCEEGIKISKKPQATFTLEPLQEVTLEGEVKIDQKIEKKDRNQPAHKINSKILIDGTLIPLTNGIRVHSPIDITFYPEYFSGYPGSQGILQITLKNNLNESIEGILSIVPHPMINVSSLNESFKISKEGYAGVTVKIEIPKDTGNLVIPLRLYTTLKKGNEEIQTKEQVLPIKSFTHGGVLASIEGEGKILSIENEVTRAVIGLHNGGRLHSFHSKISERHYANSLHDAIGPPFWPTETDRKDFKCQLFREEGRIRARLYTDLDTYPGLRIIKDVTLFPSTEIIKIQYSFINSSSTISHDFQLMMRTIINLDDARIIIPLKNGILSTIADGDFPHWEADLPKNPASLSETWFCIEYPDTGEVLGLLWHPENIVKNSFGRAEELFFKPKILEPQSTVFLQPMYLVGGFGKWSRIRELWKIVNLLLSEISFL
jgi:ribosomal protein S18 acetylase RimI-like enzyme